MEPKVCTIVLSYNRPRMLMEALKSIQGADEVIVLDDGSDFDVAKLVSGELARFPKSCIRLEDRVPLEYRLKTPRLGKSINGALLYSSSDIITYLCDDDLFHKDWVGHVREFFRTSTDDVVRAKWGVFNDGEMPGDKLCPLLPHLDMTTGNFAHRRSCSVECMMFWNETTTAVHDAWFITQSIFARYPLGTMKKLDVLAGWRREHLYNMMNYTDGNLQYTKEAAEVLSRKTLE